MIDVNSILQWIVANKNTLSNAVTIAQGVNREYKDAQARAQRITQWDIDRRERKTKYLREQFNRLIPEIRTLVFKHSKKPGITINSYAFTSKIDYSALAADLAKLGDDTWEPISLGATAAFGKISYFVKDLSSSVANVLWRRDIEPVEDKREEEYFNTEIKPFIIQVVGENCNVLGDFMPQCSPNYERMSNSLKGIGVHRTAYQLKEMGEFKSPTKFIEEICSIFKSDHMSYIDVNLLG